MLVLTRKTGETLHIGKDISITILATKGGQVRIGIQAPKEISVSRQELNHRVSPAVPESALKE